MIGKTTARAANSEVAAVLKNKSGDGEGDEAAVFKSLLDSLQDSTASEDHEAEEVNPKAEDIFKILSEGNLKDEDVKAQLRQLLNQLKQGGQGQDAQPERADGAESTGTEAGSGQAKIQLGEVVAELRGLLDRHLSGEEAGILARAVESGRISEITGKITQILSEGNLKDEDVKAQLRQLMNQLKQGGQGQAAQPERADGAESTGTEAGSGQAKIQLGEVVAELRGLLDRHLSGEEAGRFARAVESGRISEITGKITQILSEGNLKDEDVKAQLRQLMNQLKQEAQGQAALSRKAEGGAADHAQPEGKKITDSEQAAPAKSIENKSELFSRSGDDDKEMITRDKSKESLSDKQKKIIDNFFMKGASEGVSEKGLEMKGAQVRKSMKKEDRKPVEGGSGRSGGVEGERRSFYGLASLSANANGQKSISNATNGTGNSIDSSADEQEIVWKEYSTESAKEEKESGQQMVASSSQKLSQIPIANGALRKRILPALTQNVLKAASEAGKTPGQWQKHHFVLDDGKKMQLSVREAQGVLQVKMGSMNTDLSKLLQQHLQQIREHLKQELGSEIDLQLDHPEEEGPASHFSEDSPNRNGRDEYPPRPGGVEPGSKDTGKINLKTVRSFGYNEMEWIA